MRKDIIQYSPTARGTSPPSIRRAMPEQLLALLLEGERFNEGLCVATSDISAISELDKYFRVGETLDFIKWRHVEISKREIEAFSHFCISPKAFYLGRDLEFDLLRPTCHLEECPWGSSISTPIKVSKHAARRLGIAEIGRPWPFEIELLFSEMLWRALKELGITGVQDLKCDSYGADSEEVSTPAYCARIVEATHYCADAILFGGDHCAEHSTVNAPYLFNLRMSRSNVPNSDFFVIDRVYVAGKEYYYFRPLWCISRRVLQLLLGTQTPGLQTATWIIKEKFRPLMIQEP